MAWSGCSMADATTASGISVSSASASATVQGPKRSGACEKKEKAPGAGAFSAAVMLGFE